MTDAALRGVPARRSPGPELPAVLAIDGGNSKTDVALVAADGTVLARERGPGSNWQSLGEVVTMAVTAIRRLGLAGMPLKVVLGGSVLAAADRLLTGLITAGLAGQAPEAEVRVVDVPPVAGAALLGLDQVGAPAGAEARLRAAFRPGS